MKTNVEPVDVDKPQSKLAKVSSPIAGTSGLADEVPVDDPSLEIPEPPVEDAKIPVSDPPDFQNEVEKCSKCKILKEENRQLRNRVKTLKKKLTKRKSEKVM